uniref:ER membrane protein complex subunit 7 beta-sandwich domain-containing protein n=1 Tax=Panagrolaimus superbus TaxID=310955 RepID=A0A914Z0K3_9BILA
MKYLCFLASLILFAVCAYAQEPQALFKIEGKAELQKGMNVPSKWKAESRVLVNYGEYISFLKEDGSFLVEGVPSGSYIVEIANVDYIFEPVRVDINSKGKARARRLNLLQPNTVEIIPYPLALTARQPTRYFRPREEWRITDVLMNPMVIMLLVAFVLMVVTPKLTAQDPQLQKEMQNVQMPKVDMPDVADVLANFFGGGSKKSQPKKIAAKSR